LNISQEEGQKVVRLFNDSAPDPISRITIAGTKYVLRTSNDRAIHGTQGPDGVIYVKTGTTVLVGVYADGKTPEGATKVVEALADYLRPLGL
jgi:profilin